MPGNKDKPPQAPNNEITAVAPPWMANVVPTTLPAFGPGQQASLANDLAAGGFGTPKANHDWLNQIYQPAQTYKFGPPPVTPPPPPPPVVPPPKPPTTHRDRRSRSDR